MDWSARVADIGQRGARALGLARASSPGSLLEYAATDQQGQTNPGEEIGNLAFPSSAKFVSHSKTITSWLRFAKTPKGGRDTPTHLRKII